jgi:peptide deformylase
MNNSRCPCGSKHTYSECCKLYHDHKKWPEHPTDLVKARYSAYALNLPLFIVETTHPASPQYEKNKKKWVERIAEFCKKTEFQRLEILHTKEHGSITSVTFKAFLIQNQQNASFGETSFFAKRQNKWFYRNGRIFESSSPHLLTLKTTQILPLAYYGEPILRKKCSPVKEITPEIRTLIEEMIETMDACDGVGLAAPQVHHSLRIFVMRAPVQEEGKDPMEGEPKVFINPELSLPSQKTHEESEGCLSIPTIHGDVIRPWSITVKYMNLEGATLQETLSGLEARIVMHENDHINGVLFIDRISKKERKEVESALKHLQHRIHDGTEL